MAKPSQPADAPNQEEMDFVLIEIALGMTFLDLPGNYSQLVHQQQAERHAVNAFRSALSFVPRLQLRVEEQIEISTKLEGLKIRLTATGLAL